MVLDMLINNNDLVKLLAVFPHGKIDATKKTMAIILCKGAISQIVCVCVCLYVCVFNDYSHIPFPYFYVYGFSKSAIKL